MHGTPIYQRQKLSIISGSNPPSSAAEIVLHQQIRRKEERLGAGSSIRMSKFRKEADVSSKRLKMCGYRDVQIAPRQPKRSKVIDIDKSYKGGFLEDTFSFENILARKQYFNVRIGSNPQPLSVLMRIKSVLNEDQKKQFMSSCFGNFLDLPKCKFSGQLIHSLLLRKCKPSRNFKELWFRLDTKVLRFSRVEFWIATGLKMCSNGTRSSIDQTMTSFKKKYFSTYSSVRYLEFLVDCIGKCPPTLSKNSGRKSTKKSPLKSKLKVDESKIYYEFVNVDDGDAVMLCLLYFLECGLIGKNKKVAVCKDALLLASNIDDFNNYEWGEVVFGCLFDCLSRDYFEMSCTARELQCKKDEGGFKLGEDERIRFQLSGFPLAFQLWIYEAIPALSLEYAIYRPQSFPLILKWSSSMYPDFNEVHAFLNNNAQLRVNTVLTFDGSPIFGSLVDHVEEILFDSVTLSQAETMGSDAPASSSAFFRKKLEDVKKMHRSQECKKSESSYVTLDDMNAFYSKITSYIDEKFNKLELLIKTLSKSQGGDYFKPVNIENEVISTRSFHALVPTKNNESPHMHAERKDDMPSFDLGIDCGSTQIIMKTPLASPDLIDSETCSQLEHFAQVYHSGSRLRCDVSNSILLPFIMDLGKRLIKPSRFLCTPYVCPIKKTTTLVHDSMEVECQPTLPVGWLKNFDDWFKGRRSGKLRLRYRNLEVNKADFFKPLSSANGWLEAIHIDAILYEIRSWKVRYPSTPYGLMKYTTVDVYFSNACKMFMDKSARMGNISLKDVKLNANEYLVCFAAGIGSVSGLDFLAQSWEDLDVVYAPVNVDYNHWICCAVCLKDRMIKIYDSLETIDVVEKCNHIAIMVPHILHHLQYHGYGQGGTFDPCEPFSFLVVSGVPKQVNNHDCGIWCVKYVEFLVKGWRFKMINSLSFTRIRRRYCAQFFNNGGLDPEF